MTAFKFVKTLLFLPAVLVLFVQIPALAEEDPVTDQCASTQPELRKLFPTETGLFKNFEGIWSDIPDKESALDRKQRNLLVNSNSESITMQLDSRSSSGVKRTTTPTKVRICKTRDGMMRVLGDNFTMDILVLSGLKVRFKIGNTWDQFTRIHELHTGFMPVTSDQNAPVASPKGPAQKLITPASSTKGIE